MNRTSIRRTVLVAIATAVSSTALAQAQTGSYKIDPAHSQAFFTVGHLGVANFTGRFDQVKGEIATDGSTGKVVAELDIASLNTGHAERDKHLRSPDFFSSAQYPKARFESSKVVLDAKGEGIADGNLTIRGVTKPVAFKVRHVGAGKDPWGGFRSGYVVTTTIKRSDFGINFMPGGLGEDVNLQINVEGVRQ